jgi:DNA-binding GntR family transcriptional regulator
LFKCDDDRILSTIVLVDQRNVAEKPSFSIDGGQSLSDQVYDHLSDQLERGEISFGDPLNIKDIAAQLNVSSMPIRDAIKRLEQEHIVTVNPRSRCYVRVPRKQDVLDAIDARRMIEHFALSTVYSHIRLAEMVRMDEIVRCMKTAVEAECGDPDDRLDSYIELDRQFHHEICGLCRNAYVDRFYTVVNMHLSMNFSYGMGECHGIETTFREHEAIVAHMKAHSAEALTVLDEHLNRSRHNILNEPSFIALPD